MRLVCFRMTDGWTCRTYSTPYLYLFLREHCLFIGNIDLHAKEYSIGPANMQAMQQAQRARLHSTSFIMRVEDIFTMRFFRYASTNLLRVYFPLYKCIFPFVWVVYANIWSIIGCNEAISLFVIVEPLRVDQLHVGNCRSVSVATTSWPRQAWFRIEMIGYPSCDRRVERTNNCMDINYFGYTIWASNSQILTRIIDVSN